MSDLYKEMLEKELVDKENKFETRLKSLSKDTHYEYQKNRKLYEQTKSIIMGEIERIEFYKNVISSNKKETNKLILISVIVGVVLILLTNSSIEKLGLILFLFFIYWKDKVEHLLSDARIKILLIENNLIVLNNDCEKMGVSNVSHQVDLHKDFWRYLDGLRNNGKTEEEIDKDELLKEKLNLMKLDNLGNLVKILDNIEDNQRIYFEKED